VTGGVLGRARGSEETRQVWGASPSGRVIRLRRAVARIAFLSAAWVALAAVLAAVLAAQEQTVALGAAVRWYWAQAASAAARRRADRQEELLAPGQRHRAQRGEPAAQSSP